MIKKTNQFVSFQFVDVRLPYLLNNLGGAPSLGFFFKAYKTSRTEVHFPYEWFHDRERLNSSHFPPFWTFFHKLRNKDHHEKNFSDFQTLIIERLTSKEALSKLILKQRPATGKENYENLVNVWRQENMPTLFSSLV